MAGGVNPFGFSAGVIPAPRSKRGPADIPSAPFGFAPPPSKMQQTLAILNEYNPLPAFERLLKSPMALGGPISEQDIADGLMVAGTVTGGSAAVPKPKNALNMGIRAYHGSPHDFDRFDMSKIGTGEGAQAYGHGLYFAEKEGVARSYRDALAAKVPRDFTKEMALTAKQYGKKYAKYFDGDERAAIAKYWQDQDKALNAMENKKSKDELAKRISNAKSLLESQFDTISWGKPGKMYEVNINADPDTFLDWDKPLPADSPFRERLKEFASPAVNAAHPHERNIGKDAYLAAGKPELTGEGYYRSMSGVMDSNRARLRERYGSEADDLPVNELMRRELGAPGIKYLDAGSRAAGDGSRNYVVFDDRLVSIVRKYGIAGASAMLGYNILDGMDPAQAEELKRIEGNQ